MKYTDIERRVYEKMRAAAPNFHPHPEATTVQAMACAAVRESVAIATEMMEAENNLHTTTSLRFILMQLHILAREGKDAP